MPAKIPLRQTDISPADWRVEKYVFWERQKSVAINEVEYQQEEDQSGSFSGSIFNDPPDVITVVRNWKKGKSARIAYCRNSPKVPKLDQDSNASFLSDYIEYLLELGAETNLVQAERFRLSSYSRCRNPNTET